MHAKFMLNMKRISLSWITYLSFCSIINSSTQKNKLHYQTTPIGRNQFGQHFSSFSLSLGTCLRPFFGCANKHTSSPRSVYVCGQVSTCDIQRQLHRRRHRPNRFNPYREPSILPLCNSKRFGLGTTFHSELCFRRWWLVLPLAGWVPLALCWCVISRAHRANNFYDTVEDEPAARFL